MGLAALGASGISAYADSYSGLDASKPWNVSLSLRGFYDDNINTTHSNEKESFGFEISPSVKLHLSSPQTQFMAGYTYAADYYDKRPAGDSSHFDHTHKFNLDLQHQFTQRYSISVSDSFVVAQQASLLYGDRAFSGTQRITGDNIRNYGGINFDAQLTPLFGLEIGYNNSFFDYDDSGADVTAVGPFVLNVSPSHSGALDRLEHAAHLDTKWSITPSTVLFLGYRFSEADYTGDEPVQATSSGGVYMSDVRNTRGHTGYIGVNHVFMPDLQGTVKVGATYSESYNDPHDNTTVSPYVELSLSYTYLPESYFQLGFSHDRNANDRVGGSGDAFVHDTETSLVYATLHHRITPKLFGTLTGTFQNSEMNASGTPLSGEVDRYYRLNADLEYRFTQNFSMHGGYNYDKLDSNVAGVDFDRNQFYLGATVSY